MQVADEEEWLVVQLQQAKDLGAQAEDQHHLRSVPVGREERLLDTLDHLIEGEQRHVAAQTRSLEGRQDGEKGGDFARPLHARIENGRAARPLETELVLTV